MMNEKAILEEALAVIIVMALVGFIVFFLASCKTKNPKPLVDLEGAWKVEFITQGECREAVENGVGEGDLVIKEASVFYNFKLIGEATKDGVPYCGVYAEAGKYLLSFSKFITEAGLKKVLLESYTSADILTFSKDKLHFIVETDEYILNRVY